MSTPASIKTLPVLAVCLALTLFLPRLSFAQAQPGQQVQPPAQPAPQAQPQPPAGHEVHGKRAMAKAAGEATSGRITLTMGQGGFLLGASGGQGRLVFRGRTYFFELGGLGLGEFGGSRADCVGEVVHLNRIEDFPGAYVQLEKGYTGPKGKGEVWLQNTNGVEIWLRSKTKGLDLTAEAEGVMIKFKGSRK